MSNETGTMVHRDECGELTRDSVHVIDATRNVTGDLLEVEARYARYWSQDAIEVTFDTGPWFTEALLCRENAGRLLDRLTAAIAAYDAREPQRREHPTYHHLMPDDDEMAEYAK